MMSEGINEVNGCCQNSTQDVMEREGFKECVVSETYGWVL